MPGLRAGARISRVRQRAGSMPPRLARIRVFPIKSLDPLELERAEIASGTIIARDREFALFDAKGRALNGKRLGSSILRVRARYAGNGERVELTSGTEVAAFDLRRDREGIERWFERILGLRVFLDRDPSAGFPDDREASGPTVLGSASIEAVAGWFGMRAEEVRRRFRANLEIDGLEPFEEDLLFGPPGEPRRFRIGEVEFLGTNPCARCAVPTLDSFGRELAGPFVAREFAALRERYRHPNSEIAGYGHYFRLAINTRIAPRQAGKSLRVGDRLVPVARGLALARR